MYATHTRHPTSGQGRWVDEALASAPADRIGIVVSRAMHARRAGFDASVLAFLADDPGRPETYAVESSHLGTEPGPARFVQLVLFGGPRSPEWVDAQRRSGSERIWPAVQDTPGLVESMILRSMDGATLLVGLATTADALVEMSRRTMSTSLLPWEDPATLTGPDRFDIEIVAHAELPLMARVPR